MSDPLIADIRDLLEVGAESWLSNKRQAAQDAADAVRLGAHRAERRARLRKLEAHMARVAEVDARIALIEVTPGLAERARYLRRLRELRATLIAERQR